MLLLLVVLGLALATVVVPATTARATEPTPAASARLSDEEAAALAAKLANEEAERWYGRQPFRPSQYPLEFSDGRFVWGRLDLAGEGGFSARVSFGPRGENPRVRVYYSSDVGFAA